MRSALLFLALTFASSATAETYRFHLSGSFHASGVPAEIAIGDRFDLRFDLITDTADSSPDPTWAQLLGALRDLAFSLEEGASGSYAGGFLESGDFHLMDGMNTHPLGPDVGGFTNPAGPNFPSASGLEAGFLELSLVPLSESTIDLASGGFPHLVTGTLDLDPGRSGFRIYFGPIGSSLGAYATLDAVTYTVIPEPGATVALSAATCLVFAGFRRRRKA